MPTPRPARRPKMLPFNGANGLALARPEAQAPLAATPPRAEAAKQAHPATITRTRITTTAPRANRCRRRRPIRASAMSIRTTAVRPPTSNAN